MTDATLPVPVPTDHSQWRIETLQLVNWGGFHGHHLVRFAPGSTLMSGGSGSGKSTVLDAYIALMMPSDVPFNGASNEAGGRARSAGQRNLLTYLRGKTDTARVDGSDELRDHVLRGRDGGHVWGGIAGTFVNDAQRRFTIMRLYFVKAGATVNADITTTYATFEGYCELSTLEQLAVTRFEKRSLRAVGIVPYTTLREFQDTFTTRLGIGGSDGGHKALRLLARVQGNLEVKRVDDLYKKMVLEKPITYEVADEAIAHFADLQASYDKMQDEAEKVKALQRLPELQVDLLQAEQEAALLAAIGADRDGPTPFRLWRLRTERVLLDDAVARNRDEYASWSTSVATLKSDVARLEGRLSDIAEQKRANGGDAIDARRREIESLQRDRETAYAASIKFSERTSDINLVTPETADEFAQAQRDATAFLAAYDERQADLRAEQEQFRDDLAPLTTQRRELLAERSSLQGRASSVPRRMHQARVDMAQAAGLDPEDDLPFVAELIDVLPDEEHWRKAIETTLGGVARTVLVDRKRLAHLSRTIEPIRISPRIRFVGVDLAEYRAWHGDPDHVSGKLAFKESGFSAWVQDRVSSRSLDHLCVPGPDAFTDTEPCVTPSGQTRDGNKGAHGESGDGSIIGFSNKRRLADIEARLAELDPRIRVLDDQVKQLDERLRVLAAQEHAHRYVTDQTWASIDHLGITRRIDELRDEITRLRQANSILDQLQQQEEELSGRLRQANKDLTRGEDRLDALTKEHGVLVDDTDQIQDGIDAIEQSQTAELTTDQQDYLDELFATSWDASDLKGFSSNIKGLRRALADKASDAGRRRRSAVGSMESMFTQFQQHWPDNNLGVAAESADGYRDILDRIQNEGLHERRERWRREFAAWSSDDLLRLGDAYDTAIEEIEDRLEPINHILADLPFGGKGHLQIHHRRLQNDEVQRFRKELRTLSSGLAAEVSDQQVETRFKRLAEFMARISIPEGHARSSTSQRDRFLDVRQHVFITAVCLDENGDEVATYDSLGGKSGGETQELVAFIVGSALRYQLGDEERSRPRFAPVFLDEGFVKADSEFAGRAVTAWQRLGFQLIVAGPFDKVTSLEPHMDLLLTVVKSDKGYSKVTDLPDAKGAPA
ncbi:ATP-binding protein [Propionibacterium australiense]|uniref:Exonuclease SbcCD, C subunit n=1 Tax=Propionibacterium australiense TaxID=119981 RepID=A0A383S7P5_9ACTN|nr:SbcC/MukB-like Walker B domain-containing protein [Propionibacterium australiense]RLP09675.1 hypothetical protein D7U36_07750 [Propionibacterium australiense]RLP12377.1 hypothetical protein D9T14_00530 [Propionibacterium australiense]SYZ33582.1 Putative exonuclease SbcCD, C subunit [Propionibacterium australiense]VEH89529.1 chromosome segregation protein [Propionibacterium australiense]